MEEECNTRSERENNYQSNQPKYVFRRCEYYIHRGESGIERKRLHCNVRSFSHRSCFIKKSERVEPDWMDETIVFVGVRCQNSNIKKQQRKYMID